MYGLDIQNGNRPDWYFGKKEFNKVRNRANLSATIDDQTTSYLSLLKDKFLFSRYLTAFGFPTPKVVALCDREKITWLDTHKIQPFTALLNHRLDVFVKDLLGECAKGVFSLETTHDSLRINGVQSGLTEFKMRLVRMNILQERIRQHPEMNRLYPDSVNTIRLLTVSRRRRIIPIAAVLRIGVKGLCDNLTAGGVAVGVDIETGKLTRHGVMRPAFGRIVRRHPVSGVPFDGFEIPFFKQAVELIRRLHLFFYGIRCVGWDIAVTPDGPVVVEGNDNWEVPTFQFFDSHFKQKLIDNLA